ncbi:MAG: phenylalanine--tRNA ligase subunit beta [Crocinitomicaceae bacterium]|nr:phenylalanine--tRNA ligase subunit beta [Crocinitomicaceae bacterium]MBK8926058.1 phenylalanine--tRNA ligase subunit beta [Crocinitomicaceae bacterium]
MKISYNWLKDYLDFTQTPNEIAEILTSTGLEVESVEKTETYRGGLAGVVVGHVLTKEKHPAADRLSLTTVDIGTGSPLHIVCGAPNVDAGQKVLVATVGCTLYPTEGEPLKIKKSKIRGEESEGMICAEDELGLGESHDGILILPTDTKIGLTAAEYFHITEDYLLEIGLTPNRSDAMSHIGVARDIKAWLNVHQNNKIKIKYPAVKQFSVISPKELCIEVQNTVACPQYCGAVIKGISVSESPDWLKTKLRSIGLKPINNVVDITNFVLHETGNPLHAFDLSKTGGHICVRDGKPAEKIYTLDGIERNNLEENLMICNASEPLCIAGVMGGLHSGITQNTKDIFLEAAFFNPSSVRKSARRHILNSDSSFRFERGVDQEQVIYARNRAIGLILEIAGGELKEVHEVISNPHERKSILLDFDYCRKICGVNYSSENIITILTELEYIILEKKDNSALVQIPAYRFDVTRPADLCEEILRIHGFNNVPLPEKLNTSITLSNKPDHDKLVNMIADLLSDSGYFEIMNNSLESSSFYNQTIKEVNDYLVRIQNPLSNELDVMRYSMIPGGLRNIEYNQNRQHADLRFYEFGKTYAKNQNNYVEKQTLSIYLSGRRREENWLHTDSVSTACSFYSAKSIAEKIIMRLGISTIQTHAVENNLLQDGLLLASGDKNLCQIGWIKTSVKNLYGIRNDVFYVEFAWDEVLKLISKTKIEFKSLPKTQFVRRDFSLLLDKVVRYEDIRNLAIGSEKKLLKEVNLFDVYEGKNLPDGKKSYAVSFIFQDNEKTLQDAQVDLMMQNIRTKLEIELKAELR